MPRILRHAPLGEGWFIMVLAWVPGAPPTRLSDMLLERLVDFIQVHVERGAPIHLVQATLGHTSVATTGRYLHARPTDSSARYMSG